MDMEHSQKKHTITKTELCIIVLGAVLRLKHFLENRSLWLDEAYTAGNIFYKRFADIFNFFAGVYKAQPRTPILFQFIEKVNVTLFGANEMAFRLWPFVAGLLGLWLFYLLLREYARPAAGLMALSLFALNPILIDYSAQLKPYSSDVFFAIILFLLFIRAERMSFSVSNVRIFGWLSGLFLWLSYPSFFISAGIFTVMLGQALFEKNIKALKKWSAAFLIFLLNFIIVYAGSMQVMSKSRYIKSTWSNSFLPLNEGLIFSLRWVWDIWLAAFQNPLSVAVPVFGLIIFIVGAIAMILKKRLKAFVLLTPLALCFLAACIQAYPFKQRALLFLVPVLCLVLGEGTLKIAERARHFRRSVFVVLALILLLEPFCKSVEGFFSGYPRTQNREVLSVLRKQVQPGDFVFLNNSAQYAFIYYIGAFDLIDILSEPCTEGASHCDSKIHLGKTDDDLDFFGETGLYFEYDALLFKEGRFTGDVERSRTPVEFSSLGTWEENDTSVNSRVWLFLSHIDPQIKNTIVERFDRRGKYVSGVEGYDAYLYLYVF